MKSEDHGFKISVNEDNRIQLLQYENLRKHFVKLVEDVLGKDYYNMGCDVYTCDELCCEDLKRELKIKGRLFKLK